MPPNNILNYTYIFIFWPKNFNVSVILILVGSYTANTMNPCEGLADNDTYENYRDNCNEDTTDEYVA